jgi:hypothetical protein
VPGHRPAPEHSAPVLTSKPLQGTARGADALPCASKSAPRQETHPGHAARRGMARGHVPDEAALAGRGTARAAKALDTRVNRHFRWRHRALQGDDKERGLDFIHDTTVGGRSLKMLVVLDEYTGECLAIEVERTFRDANFMADLDELTAIRGALVYIRRENGPELVRKSSDAGARTQTQARTSSSPERRGRSASWRASTAGCATSCCRRRPLRRRPRPSTSSTGGDATTTTVGRTACAGHGDPRGL